MNLRQNKLIIFYFVIIVLIYSQILFGNITDPNLMTLCIAPLANNTDSKEYDAFADGLSDLLVAALNDYNNIRIVERQRLDQILKEQQLSLTGLVQPTTALKVGKLLKADSIIIGGMTKPKDKFIVNLHLYDVDSSRLLASKMIQSESDQIVEKTYALANELFSKPNLTLRPIDPNDIDNNPAASLHFMRGLGYYYTSDYNRSIVHFMKAINNDKEYVKARLWMAKTYIANNEHEHARVELQKIINQFPKSEESIIAAKLQKEIKH